MAQNKIADLISPILADTYALAVKTHAAHWNVVGTGFFELHTAFGSQYEELLDAADELAERLRAIGVRAPSGMKAMAKAASVADLAEGAGSGGGGSGGGGGANTPAGAALARALRDDHRTLSKACAKGVHASQELGDEATADLFIQRIEAHDKTAWMLDAYAS